MYRTLKHLAAVGAVAAVALMGGQAMAATGTGTASVTVATPLVVTHSADLSFGTIAAGVTTGTVSVDAAGSRTATGVTLLGGTPSAGAFHVTGETGQAFNVSVSTPVSLVSGANSMSAALSVTPATDTVSGSGNTVNVSGTLSVGANQPGGTYNATYTVTVNY